MTNEKEHRLIQLKGSNGLGKRAMVDYAIGYCMDRGYFKDGAYRVKAGSGNQA